MDEEKKKRRGGNMKSVAPAGNYTAAQAIERLGFSRRRFYSFVDAGKIPVYRPPQARDGYYPKKEVDMLADELAIYLLQTSESIHTVFRQATPDDAEGIHNVIKSLGWPATPADRQRGLYKNNDKINWLVEAHGLIIGYINASPFTESVREGVMSGRLRGWDIRPDDILPYVPGLAYNLFTGIAVRQDVPARRQYAARLISGFLRELENMARAGITVKCMYAVSDQPDGIELCTGLGFVKEPVQKGDLFGRYVLDIEAADSPFAKRYREAIDTNKQPRHL
jgi:hypothetical protein